MPIAFGVAIYLSIAISLPVWAEEGPQGNAVHVVIMWFEDDKTAIQRQQVVDVTRGFKAIPGVIDIRVGEAIKEAGDSPDALFSVALYIVFENAIALQGYSDHPIHLAARASGILAGLVRMETYDFIDDP